MKFIGLLIFIAITTVNPAVGFFSQFVILTPNAGREHQEFQPWLYSDRNQPEIVSVVIPFHKGMKKYWLISATHALEDDQLNFRSLITASYKPIPKYITTIIPLCPQLDDLGQPEAAGFIVFRVRRDELARHYVYHDFSVGVDDGGYFRTYKLSAYPIGKQFDELRVQEMEASATKRRKEVEELIRNDEESKRWMEEWTRKQKEKKDGAAQPASDVAPKSEGTQKRESGG